MLVVVQRLSGDSAAYDMNHELTKFRPIFAYRHELTKERLPE